MAKRLQTLFIVFSTMVGVTACASANPTQRNLFGKTNARANVQFEEILDDLGILGMELRRLEETYQQVKSADA